MRTGNLQSSGAAIQEAFDHLMQSWKRTREQWSDQNAQEFEENSLRPIAEELAQLLPALSQVSQTFGTASRECSE